MTSQDIDPAGLVAGQELPPFERRFESVDMVAYGAATWDWHRLHHDTAFARSRGLDRPVVDGQMFGGLFARQAMDWAGPRAFIQAMRLRMRSMAYAGDVLQGTGEVGEIRLSDDHGVAVLAQRLKNGEAVIADCVTEIRLPR